MASKRDAEGSGSPSSRVIAYHERTKHHPHRYARSPGYMDWKNEPNPFRSFGGAPHIILPLREKDPNIPRIGLYEERLEPQPLSMESLAAFLELSMGLSAWKSYGGARWALRINPSSGNLHPTELHLILPPLDGEEEEGGIYHYMPYSHGLERRASFGMELWQPLAAHFGQEGFLATLTSISWREAWKYGERAYRYCNQDAGHAIACLAFSANLLGWKVLALSNLPDDEIEGMLGFGQAEWVSSEREEVDLMLFVSTKGSRQVPRGIPEDLVKAFSCLSFTGRPNRLSPEHVEWHVIDEVSDACRKGLTTPETFAFGDIDFTGKEAILDDACMIIRQRRSAVAFDAESSLEKEAFFAILDKILPRNGCVPFDTGLGPVSVHLLLFIHRVKGLDAGLYLLFRDQQDRDEIMGLCTRPFAWERVEAPPSLSLFLLSKGDVRELAKTASCHQEIASDGVFAAAMIARFRDEIARHAHAYKRLHWEAGMIGQVLYLEAEAWGMRGTGMGCFFDDVVHDILGIRDNAFQDLYHFGLGKPVEDPRLLTLPPYRHLSGPS